MQICMQGQAGRSGRGGSARRFACKARQGFCAVLSGVGKGWGGTDVVRFFFMCNNSVQRDARADLHAGRVAPVGIFVGCWRLSPIIVAI